jgi:DNA-binding transcriptional ArsR family regulator
MTNASVGSRGKAHGAKEARPPSTWDAVFDALGDPTRRRIFESLEHGAMSVTELSDKMPVSRPAVSQHLRVLEAARLVRWRAEGTRRLYETDDTGLKAASSYLDRFWDRALARFKKAAEAEAKGKKK